MNRKFNEAALRKIIHIDMDCFYAAVEERDNPELKGKPLAVGGPAVHRGVLCTCNYVARRFGLHSAMATAKALQLCPQLILLPVDMPKYRKVSEKIRHILAQYTAIIEPLSLDEAYLDVTDANHFQGSATLIAKAIKEQICEELALIASAGVAPNKLLAKIASDWQKPDGLYVIRPEQVSGFMTHLPVSKLFGVGRVMAQKLQDWNIKTCGELQARSLLELSDRFGQMGARLFEMCRGNDKRAVQVDRVRKSLSVEHTLDQDLSDLNALEVILRDLLQELSVRLERHQEHPIKNLFVKVKFADFKQTTVECLQDRLDLPIFLQLYREALARHPKAIRLLGLGVRFVEPKQVKQCEQLSFGW